ncbi:MAG: DUF433 domain-containing protein [Ignavibacteriae bacterium]|nr:DUF433 domain-containing protein [Ignavibacteriota bacterium]
MITKERKQIRNSERRSSQPTVYPYIERNPKILNGIPIIEGTRISVATVAGYFQLGMSVDEILISLKHLTQAQVHSALAYYFDHRQEIEKQAATSSDTEYWKTQALLFPNSVINA